MELQNNTTLILSSTMTMERLISNTSYSRREWIDTQHSIRRVIQGSGCPMHGQERAGPGSKDHRSLISLILPILATETEASATRTSPNPTMIHWAGRRRKTPSKTHSSAVNQ